MQNFLPKAKKISSPSQNTFSPKEIIWLHQWTRLPTPKETDNGIHKNPKRFTNAKLTWLHPEKEARTKTYQQETFDKETQRR